MTAFPDIAANLARIRARIAEATARANRPADAVTLVAVSKTNPAEAVAAALAAGQTVFGENRVQEAAGNSPRCGRHGRRCGCTSSAACRPTRHATPCGSPM